MIEATITTPETEVRKPYAKPAIVHELELETRAGSPIGGTFNPITGLPDF